jgi:hypothetical protein
VKKAAPAKPAAKKAAPKKSSAPAASKPAAPSAPKRAPMEEPRVTHSIEEIEPIEPASLDQDIEHSDEDISLDDMKDLDSHEGFSEPGTDDDDDF